MTFTERYVHTGKVALNVAEWEAPTPGALPVVLIHGYASSWLTWGRVTDKLSTMFKLFAIDLRGMGRSGRWGNGSERQIYPGDIATALPLLTDQPALLAGHSLGGWVTAAVASRHPKLVSRVMLVDPYTGAQSEVGKRARIERHEQRLKRAEQIKSARTPDDLIPLIEARYAGAAESSIRRLARMYFELDPVLEAGRLNPSDDFDQFESLLAAIECPVLIIRGNVEKGGIMSDEEAERVVDLIPNSRLLSWPKVGHSPHIARSHDFIRAAKRFAAE
jgi:pimeloyl-ACP methyl ester carboxylesterase